MTPAGFEPGLTLHEFRGPIRREEWKAHPSFPVMLTLHTMGAHEGRARHHFSSGTELAATFEWIEPFSKEVLHEIRAIAWDRHSHRRHSHRGCLGGHALEGGYGFLQPEGGPSQQGKPGAARSRGDSATRSIFNAARDACFARNGRSAGPGHGQPSARQQSDRWANNGQHSPGNAAVSTGDGVRWRD